MVDIGFEIGDLKIVIGLYFVQDLKPDWVMVHQRYNFVLKFWILFLKLIKFFLKSLQNKQISVFYTFLFDELILKFAFKYFDLIFQVLDFLLLVCDD